MKSPLDVLKNVFGYPAFRKGQEEIIKAIERLRKYINEKQIEEFVKGVKNEDYDNVIKDLMIKYYDKAYSSMGKTYERVFNNDNEDKCVKELTEYIFLEK